LRNINTETVVVVGQSALLQRDGDIVAVDGVSNPTFSVDYGGYYIVVKHRNHLSIRSSYALTLSDALATIDLSNSIYIIEGGSNAVVELENGLVGMMAGDYDENAQVQNSDINYVISILGSSGYTNADIDLNGQVQNTDIYNLMNPNLGKGEQF